MSLTRAGRLLQSQLNRVQSVPAVFYHENVVEQYENPRNVGSLDKKDRNVGTGLVGAPACGDVMKLQIKVDDYEISFFCGGGDCPDWVLAQIHSTLSNSSAIKLGVLAQIVAENITNEDIPEDKVKDLTESKTDGGFAKSAVSCVRFLLTSAARNNTPETTLCEELQQLGLPKDHSHILCRVLLEKLKHIQKLLLEGSLYEISFFCGGGDCPDWVLAQIHSTLSNSSAIKLGVLAQIVAENITNEDIPEDKVKDLTESKTDGGFAKSAVSCVRFLLTSAARNNTPETTLCEELQQLGLPKDHSHILCRVLLEKLKHIQKLLLEGSLYVNLLDDISCESIHSRSDCAQINLKIKNEIVNGHEKATSYQIKVRDADLAVLINELKTFSFMSLLLGTV